MLRVKLELGKVGYNFEEGKLSRIQRKRGKRNGRFLGTNAVKEKKKAKGSLRSIVTSMYKVQLERNVLIPQV